MMSGSGDSGEQLSEKKDSGESSKVDSGGGNVDRHVDGGECSSSQGSAAQELSRIDAVSANAESSKPNSEGTLNQRNSESSADAELPSAEVDAVKFSRRRRSEGRQYRRRSGPEESSADELQVPSAIRGVSSPDSDFQNTWQEFLLSSSSSDSSHSSMSEIVDRSERRLLELEENSPPPKVLLKPKAVHKWFAVREIVNREVGCGSRWQGPERFQQRYYGSLHAVQRLELMYKLDKHRGCVNSLNFNRKGDLLVSASDDKQVVIWDWAADRSVLSYDSGHTGNVFQAKFLPLDGDRHIVTCARDGQVRLSVLSGVGVCKGTRLLAQHRRTVHKLAIHPNTPHVFLSAGEDALVLSHDVRTNKATKIMFVKEGGSKRGLYSIHSNPACSDEFLVTGEDQYIRLYDKRKIGSHPLKKLCPKNLLAPCTLIHVTCAVFNYNGSEVLGSYNDDDIYLFDTQLPSEADYVHKYEGHRNSITVKGVNFFGPRSEFIVSGSDCGNIYFWDKNTESIVQWMRGDEEGVVNCLEPHPQVPIIATSGLDSDIKIWVPSCEQEPTLKGLKSTVLSNQADRDSTRGSRSDPLDNQQMRWLWEQIQRFEDSHREGATRGTEGDASPTRDGGMTSSSTSDEEGGESGRPQCSPS